MRQTLLLLRCVLCLCAVLVASPSVRALEVPRLQGYVNDYAGMMSDRVRSELESTLRDFEQTDSTQIVILTIPSLEGETLEEFSMKVAESWKIGQQGKDNGIILLVARQERRVRIEVGRGLEGRMTDLMAGRIIDLVIAPRFRRGDFDGGFVAGVNALIDGVRGEYRSPDGRNQPAKDRIPQLTSLLIYGFILLMIFGRISRIISGVVGAIGLPLIAKSVFPVGGVFIPILAAIGFFAGYLIPAFLSFGRRDHGRTMRSGGIPWTGGISHGGGFGGFSGGGGSFGGGGASGRW